jgi:signal transduction histidine kinase
VQINNATKRDRASGQPAVNEVSRGLAPDEAVAVIGQSGSGKSTLLNRIAGIGRPTQIAMAAAGEQIDRLTETALARCRRVRIGIVFQFFNLLYALTVADNFQRPAQLAGMHRTKAQARARSRARREHVASAAPDAIEAQRRFLAYAAHELRGEITLQLTLAQATLADPNADTAALREMGEQVAAACWRQERLLTALLTLARSEYGQLRRELVDLAATASEVLQAHEHHGLTSTSALTPARTVGDPQLIEHLVANLVANAVRHNNPGGRLDVATYTAAGRANLTIANTGPVIPTGELTRLFQPFQRLSAHTGPPSDGVGLGLAIVQAIANAHDAALTAQAPTGGGLVIDVAFPLATESNRTPVAAVH